MLRIGTGGYTIVPNWALDGLAEAGSNALALGTLLLRLIPGQTGELLLAGPTSRRNLCAMLQWGTENSTKFDQALNAIEKTGLISTRIESGNTKIVSIHGDLQRIANTETDKILRTEAHFENRAPAKIAPAKTTRPAPAKTAADSTRVEEIKTSNKLNNLSLRHRTEAIRNTEPQDDDWASVFSFYGQCFKAIVPKSQRTRFLSSAKESGLSPQNVKDRLATLAAHPLSVTKVTSINAVWHFQHLQKTTRIFDINVRQMLEGLAQRCSEKQNFKSKVMEVLKEKDNSHLDPDLFFAYFASDIEKLVCQQERVGQGSENCSRTVSEPQMATDSPDFEADFEPIFEEEIPTENQLETPATDAIEFPISEQVPILSELENKDLSEENGPNDIISKHQEITTCSLNLQIPASLSPQLRGPINPSCNSQEDNGYEKIDLNHNVVMMEKKPSFEAFPTNESDIQSIVEELMATRLKSDFLSSLEAAIRRTELEKSHLEILETLQALTMAPKSSLNMLKSMLDRKFGLAKAS